MSNEHAFRFASPSKDCDLIMKGGVTSGVVFPQVICQLAMDYRFRNIGGTSAGAIGAVMAAAAEYRRQSSDNPEERGAGFERIASMPQALADNLPTFFQPSLRTKPLFDITMATIRTKHHRFLAAFFQTLRSFAKDVLVGSIPGVLVGAVSGRIEGA
ncbi:MAG TPA: patatin-like phospholipase family protein, partial [Mycoplana sp.]|nr:patatin-like phospholipase family protein [Mycoplana sp.]